MRPRRHIDRLRRLIGDALASGATRETMSRFQWDISGNCDAPHVTVMYAAPSGRETWRMAINRTMRTHAPGTGWSRRGDTKHVVVKPGSEIPLTLELLTRCRRCEKCRQHRARLWRRRMVAEIEGANRTWFGTLTLSPESYVELVNRARKRAIDRSVGDLDALDLGEQFRRIAGELQRETTLYLKRLRKQAAVPLRYCIVVEQHKSGVPHLHALIHEPDEPILHKVLSGQWKLGFTKWKLVENPKAASYVAKYISKTAVARVRASVRYGTVSPLFEGKALVDKEVPVEKSDLPRTKVDVRTQIRAA